MYWRTMSDWPTLALSPLVDRLSSAEQQRLQELLRRVTDE